MTAQEVLSQLETMGSEQTKKVLTRHGAREPFFGVKVGDLQKIRRKVKKDQPLASELYATGNSDAMYLAGLISDESVITKDELQKWVKGAYWYMISEYTVPWTAAESPYGLELALEWIESEEEGIAAAGWCTLSSLASRKADEDLDLDLYSNLMDRAEREVHSAPNRVRYTMNGFVIACGAYITSLTDKALEMGERIGKVSVEMGGTACKVPVIVPYLNNIIDKGRVGKKRKDARC
ncbi:DNA alkylation repair protein [bacterium SCSIO 12741]|nr:DNA alkylation repair protein [bacterium SCSIO 12741]